MEGWFDVDALAQRAGIPNLVVQSLCRILDLSHQAIEQLGQSYRGYKVGAAVLAHDEFGGRLGIYFGGNYTPYKGATWNCAEKRALEVVQKRGFNRVLAVAISGPAPHVDEISGVESPTRHPCSKCRGMLSESPLIAPDTLIATSNLTEDAYELHTAESILQLHETGEPQDFPDYDRLLPIYWLQILRYNPAAERAELAILHKIAAQLTGRLDP